jgi:putative spermidine/putrescine transport system ATP-binding protein
MTAMLGKAEIGQVPSRRVKLLAQEISKRYGSADALKPTHLEVFEGELLTVLGPSGSGKTTLLQLICGIAEPTSGRIVIDGVDQTNLPIHRRNIGVVFQNYALFPHLTVLENVSFPLQMRRFPKPELRRRAIDTLELVGLGHLRDRFPAELSGGQQQRVALARCFVYEPALILMDEPLGALDRKLRETLQTEIKRLHRQTGATILFVTHDQEEALALSDRICLMRDANIEQIGTPEALYERPATLFAANFVGISNVLEGVAADEGRFATADGVLACAGGAGTAAGRAALIIRPEHIEIVPAADGMLTGVVTGRTYAGSETRQVVTLPSSVTLTVRCRADEAPVAVGETVGLRWAPERARVLTH